MKTIRELSQEILAAWAEGAGIAVPHKDVVAPWLGQLADLARMVQSRQITVEDIRDYTRERVSDPHQRKSPQFWNLRYVVNNIYLWKTAQSSHGIPPPPGWKSGLDEQGRTHSWNWEKGEEFVVDYVEPAPVVPSTVHSPSYVPLERGERLAKRPFREGYQRDFFLSLEDSDLSPDELRQLQRLAADESEF